MKRFYVLDGWRGICACLVAMFHLKVIGHIYSGHFDDKVYGPDFSLSTFIHNSWLFVDFFFVLSGFIITHSLRGRLDRPAELIAFAIRRFGRLWPTHLIMVLALLAYRFAATPQRGADLVVNGLDYTFDAVWASAAKILAMVHALPGAKTLWSPVFLDINPPSWSISVEFWIYLGFGLLLLMRLGRWAAVNAVIVCLSGLVLYFIVGQIGATFEFGLFRCSFGFFSGVLVHWLYQAVLKSGHEWSKVAWLELPVILCVIVFVTMAGPSEWSLLGPGVFGLTVWVFAFERGPVSRAMLSKPIRKLGDLSYTVYMTHSLVAVALADGLAWLMNRLGVDYGYRAEMYGEDVSIISFPNDVVADISAVVYLGLVVVVAALMSRWVEVPCRDWFGALARRLTYQR